MNTLDFSNALLRSITTSDVVSLEFTSRSLSSSVNDLVKNLSKIICSICREHNQRQLTLAVDEAVRNSYEHGNLEITYDEKNRLLNLEILEEELQRREELLGNRKITCLFVLKQNFLTIEIADEGKGFDWKKVDSENSKDNLHGRGITLMKAAFDDVSYNSKGNRCILKKQLS